MNYIKAKELLTTKRLDVCAKTMYAKTKKMKINSRFIEELYLNHIQLWNNFYEKEPPKNSSTDFINHFDTLIESFSIKGYIQPEKNYIPVKDLSVYNGSHRLASSIVYDLEVPYLQDVSNGCEIADYKFFKNLSMSEKFLDEMVLEFIRLKKNTYTISIFSSDCKDLLKLNSLISTMFNVLCSKEIQLTEIGKKNYITTLYLGENWLGNFENNFAGSEGKYKPCFENSDKLIIYVVSTDDTEKLKTCKNIIRKMYDVGNHSVHINDTWEETWRISSTVFNRNSLNFLNQFNRSNLYKFNNMLQKYKSFIQDKNYQLFCIIKVY